MARSSKTGDDMEAGRVNRAEDQTVHWAQQRKDGFFGGNAIMVVEPARDIDDDDFEKIPERDLSGVVGTAMGGGVGIIDINMEHPYFESPGEDLLPEDLAHAQSAGVFGKGATGVVGQGETRAAVPFTKNVGAGVIGRGGISNLVVGTGVVGFGGSVEGFDPNSQFPQTLGTGVSGTGGNGVIGTGLAGAGVQGFGGPGAQGVIGIGGTEEEDQEGNKTPHGPGVIGIGFGTGNTFDFDFSDGRSYDETGVYGRDRTASKASALTDVVGYLCPKAPHRCDLFLPRDVLFSRQDIAL